MMPLSIQRLQIARVIAGVSGSVSLLLTMSLPLLAEEQPAAIAQMPEVLLTTPRAYHPPAGSRGSGSASTGGGVRGCGSQLLALAPTFSTVGQTFSLRPSFVWYLEQVPAPGDRLVFEIYHQPDGGDELLAYSQELELPTSPGFQALTLPREASALAAGETYRWTVNLYCENDLAVVGRWGEAQITVVEPPRGIALLDTVAPTADQKAIRLAQAGYWYDALAQVYSGTTAGEVALREALILDLADLAASADTSAASRWSEQLRAIADSPNSNE